MSSHAALRDPIILSQTVGLLIEVGILVNGDQVRENIECGAGSIEFKLIAFEGEPFARESELLAGQIYVIPFEGGILVLKEHAGGGAKGGEILGGIGEEPSGMIMSLAGSEIPITSQTSARFKTNAITVTSPRFKMGRGIFGRQSTM